MSDASMPHCETCNEPEYACLCRENLCSGCGEPLGQEAQWAGREMCFGCYCEEQG